MSFISFNEYVDAERSNKYAGAKIKKQQTNSVALIARSKKFILEDKKYDVVFTWFKPNHRTDHDNICFAKKFILDGIQVAGSIKGDSPRYINNFQDIFQKANQDYVSCEATFIEAL